MHSAHAGPECATSIEPYRIVSAQQQKKSHTNINYYSYATIWNDIVWNNTESDGGALSSTERTVSLSLCSVAIQVREGRVCVCAHRHI